MLEPHRHFLVAVLAVGVGLAAGCDRCTSEPPPAPPPPKDLGDLEMVEPPPEDAASKRWDALASALEISDRTPGSLAYALPPCPLRYQVRGEFFSDIAEGREPAGVITLAEILATPEPTPEEPMRLRLELVTVESALHVDGERGDKPIDPSGWPPTAVRVESRAWRETRGPSTLWAAHTVFPALASVFFPLPKSSEVGASVGWKQRIFDRGETGKAERARDAGRPPHPKAPEEQLAHLHVDRWIAIGDAGAAVLSGQWAWKAHRVEPIESRRAERWRAHAVFLESGWPLFFASFANIWRFSAPTEDQGRHALGTQLRALRLVEACEGPVLPRWSSP